MDKDICNRSTLSANDLVQRIPMIYTKIVLMFDQMLWMQIFSELIILMTSVSNDNKFPFFKSFHWILTLALFQEVLNLILQKQLI